MFFSPKVWVLWLFKVDSTGCPWQRSVVEVCHLVILPVWWRRVCPAAEASARADALTALMQLAAAACYPSRAAAGVVVVVVAGSPPTPAVVVAGAAAAI